MLSTLSGVCVYFKTHLKPFFSAICLGMKFGILNMVQFELSLSVCEYKLVESKNYVNRGELLMLTTRKKLNVDLKMCRVE